MPKNGNIHPTRIFKTPKDLDKAWNEYKEDLINQSNEWLKLQYVGKDGEQKKDPQKVPMTMEGFNRFCRNNYGDTEQYFLNTEHKDKDGNKVRYYDNFVGICSHIREEIRENQIIGGLLGFYNPSITQRLNSLTDKKETTLKGSINIPSLPDIGNRE